MQEFNNRVHAAEIKSDWVEVKTAARLHMGFFDLHGGLGRQFGSVGLSLDAPHLKLFAKKSPHFSVDLPVDCVDEKVIKARVLDIVQTLLGHTQVALTFTSLMHAHAGLGSGTQLALSLGVALNQLFNLDLTVPQIAKMTGRGSRSGIGIAAFMHGGLIIDAGHAVDSPNIAPPILARYNFPTAWCVLLIEDPAHIGVHGAAEMAAFKALPRFPENIAADLCRHVLMQTMPAMMAEDLITFGTSIHALQAHVGDYFAPAQGGRYASAAVGQALNFLMTHNAPCVGQSSWGPTGFAVFENAQIAQDYLALLNQHFKESALNLRLCHGSNRGASVTSGNL